MLENLMFCDFSFFMGEMLRSFRKCLGGALRSVWLLYLKAALSLFLGLGSSLVLLYVA